MNTSHSSGLNLICVVMAANAYAAAAELETPPPTINALTKNSQVAATTKIGESDSSVMQQRIHRTESSQRNAPS